jgi:hypothetical protein
MISCEHFTYSLATGLSTSPNLEKWLTPLELDYLCHIGDKLKTETCLRTPINPFVIAVTYIKPIRDGYNRKDVWNHTILIKYQDYFEDRELEPAKLVAPHFLSPTAKSPESLEPIKI